MKKILLLSPPYLPKYMRNARCDFVSLSKSQWYPIWLGYCGAFLEKQGFEVKFIDAPSYGYSHKETEDIVLNYRPDFLVIYSGRLSEDNDVEFGEKLAEAAGVDAVFVGPYASIAPKGLLEKTKRIKYVIEGEFEHPVLELIKGKKPEEIMNLLYKEGDDIKINGRRPLLTTEDLDEIPFVTEFFKRHLDLKKYKTPSEHYPYIDIMTGRGCDWGFCTYCLWVHTFIPGKNYNTRSIGNVIDEFKFIKNHLPEVRSVMIQDDTFTEERAVKFSEAMVRENIKLPWSCYSRGNMSYETLRLMKKAGCRNLHVGYESADNAILKNIKKGLTREKMTEFTENAHKAGVNIHGDFAIGFPGETRKSAEETIEWAYRLRPHTAQFQLMIPFPGTPFYDELKQKGWLRNGLANYPEISSEQMEEMSKKAYRRFYISLPFIKQILRHPYDTLFSQLETYWNAIPSVFWKKYVR